MTFIPLCLVSSGRGVDNDFLSVSVERSGLFDGRQDLISDTLGDGPSDPAHVADE
jgi:hypothetical protein